MIKAVHKELAFEKRAQSAFNKLVTGNLFKVLSQGSVVAPPCPVCQQEALTWPHFFVCFNLHLISIEEWGGPKVLAELARSVATFRFPALSGV